MGLADADVVAAIDAPGVNGPGIEEHVAEIVADDPEVHLVLTGRAQSIRRVRATLKERGTHRGQVMVKAYWDEQRAGPRLEVRSRRLWSPGRVRRGAGRDRVPLDRGTVVAEGSLRLAVGRGDPVVARVLVGEHRRHAGEARARPLPRADSTAPCIAPCWVSCAGQEPVDRRRRERTTGPRRTTRRRGCPTRRPGRRRAVSWAPADFDRVAATPCAPLIDSVAVDRAEAGSDDTCGARWLPYCEAAMLPSTAMPSAAPSSRVASFMAEPEPARRAGTADMIDRGHGRHRRARCRSRAARRSTGCTSRGWPRRAGRTAGSPAPTRLIPTATVRLAPNLATMRGVSGDTIIMIGAIDENRRADSSRGCSRGPAGSTA